MSRTARTNRTGRRPITASGAGRAPGGHAPAGLRRGMTLIELMIAILILNVALLALAGLGATVSRQLRQGSAQTHAALQVQSRLESLASIRPCTDIVGNNQTKTETITSAGGVTQKLVYKDGDDVIHVIDSVSVPGRTKVLVYQSMIPCRDQ